MLWAVQTATGGSCCPMHLCQGGSLKRVGGSVGRVQGQLLWAWALSKNSTFYVLETEKNLSQASERRRITKRTILQLAEEKQKRDLARHQL